MIAIKTIEIANVGGKMFVPLTEQLNTFAKDYLEGSTGILTISSKHTTACVKILEDEILSLADIKEHLEKFAPSSKKYLHDNIDLREVPPEERINGVAHVRSLYFPHSVQVPVDGGKLVLGKWQTVFLVELDGSRKREVQMVYVGT